MNNYLAQNGTREAEPATYILKNVPKDLWNKVKHHSASNGTSIRSIVVLSLQHYLVNNVANPIVFNSLRSLRLCDGCCHTFSSTDDVEPDKDIKLCPGCRSAIIKRVEYQTCCLHDIPRKLWNEIKHHAATENKPLRSIIIYALWYYLHLQNFLK